MSSPKIGDFIEMDGLLAVVVATEDNPNVPEDHVGVWFGNSTARRISEGGLRGASPEVSTVPAEYCRRVDRMDFSH